MSRRQLRSHIIAVCIGTFCTLLVALAYGLGRLDWLESKSLDLRFRYANRMPETDEIRCIDIDDEALKLVGRWPWSRDKQAALVDLLTELGAKSILVDLDWVDPEPPSLEAPASAETMFDPLSVQFHADDARFPDLVLAAALRRAGNAFLAVLFESSGASGAVASSMQTEYRAHARNWLRQVEPDPDALKSLWPDFYHAVIPDKPIENQSREKSELLAALQYVLGYNATMRGDFVALPRVKDAAQPVAEITPIHYSLARAGRGFGFVVFKPDRDGVVRRQVVLVRHEGRALPQLALAVACDALGAGPDDIWVRNHELHVNRPAIDGEPLAIQLDDAGRMMIPWIARRDWTTHFAPHVPAGGLWQVYDRRSQMADNRRNMRDITERTLVEQVEHPDAYAALLKQCKAIETKLDRLRLVAADGEAVELRAQVATLRREIASIEQQTVERIESRSTALASQPYEQHEIEIETLNVLRSELKKTVPFERANHRLQLEIDAVLDRLRPLIHDHICLIGYTATALADMTPTPINERTPGVMAHANIINGLLTGHTVRWVSTASNTAFAVLLGLLVTCVTTWRRQLESVICAALLSVVWIVVVAAAFYSRTLWIALTPAIGAMLVSYVAIIGYRYAFADRERRQLASALGQYTSKTIARQVAENPELCMRAEARVVTAMFTDLQGFTSISERIGAERTQRVLNVCLGEFTEVMLRHEAMVNKFIGDGIFAFWNPVIYPQPEHVTLACQTAVDLMVALENLIRDQNASGGDPAIAELVLRIGLATGNAIVGPCGSEQKYDYTCIGDSVNVAARLESANKFYGTRILVSGPTRDAVGDRFAFRALGGVQVKGKQRAVPIYELLARSGEAPQSTLVYAEVFSQAVNEFQRRRFERAREVFQQCLAQRPHDRAAQVYAAATEHLLAAPPADDWNAALELTAK